ncbi:MULTISPECIES: class I adenylate-forming enzyme family protein [Pseudomonas]|uniref:AMP-binding protein n=2 Tax=Pseudomonas petroselini TaxID=2899822 RepID=A0ABS8QYG0_9PSED|nr:MULTISPECIES: AMP-binding protein [Pseudomonas]MCD7040063.1 AMP-binding protein [Pseudomonas petroselini]MCD7046216.1 AMP-binding protein [Pseudomonas petroselini]MCD7067660.1 AMP-binding protein [Pseudomonas petroselini]MCM2379690.1 AMP-binding protein [Pseudomonas marginalis]MDD2031453.1 AMP-binding protein [Pseudomonas sp. 39167]
MASAPEAPCIADDNSSLTNRQFHSRVLAAAGVFADAGIGVADVVAIMLPNQMEFVIAMFAAWRLGAAVTPINPNLTSKEATHQLLDSGAKLLININGEVVLPSVQSMPVTDLEAAEPYTGIPFEDPAALALLIYTSGTTGLPKGVMLDHANIEAMSEMGRLSLKVTAADHCLLILPLFHVNGIVVSTLIPLSSGGRVTIRKRFNVETFFEDVEWLRPTYFSAVPTIYAMLNGLPNEVQPFTSSLRYGICGAAPASAQLLKKFEARFGFPLLEGYGLSEGTCASTINPFDGLRKVGTVGLPFIGQKIAIADSSGVHLPQGAIGEVLVQGPNVMRGYLGKPEETAKTVIDGWLHTGDIGQVDEDGYLSIVGRLKEMIIRGGENIYPKEIEDALFEFPGILEAAVIGAPHETFGEVVVAYIALRTGVTATRDELEEHCIDRLTRYKRPSTINIIDSLPKNAVGKVDKLKLRKMWTEWVD